MSLKMSSLEEMMAWNILFVMQIKVGLKQQLESSKYTAQTRGVDHFNETQ